MTNGWAELTTGNCDIALHGGSDQPAYDRGRCNAKIVFGCTDVEAMRTTLVEKGVAMGPVNAFKHETREVMVHICDGKDPEGNWFQISDRNMV